MKILHTSNQESFRTLLHVASLNIKINKIGFKCVFTHGTCQNGAAISMRGSAQAPMMLPILQHCNLPQSRFPPLCCLSFDLQPLDAYTRTHAHKQSYACMIA